MKHKLYRFSTKQLATRRKSLEKQAGHPLEAEAICHIVLKNIRKNPLNYLRYGPYWWAVKAIMAKHHIYLGHYDNPSIRTQFQLEDDVDTLIAAFEIGDQYYATYFVGTRNFTIYPEGFEDYHLYDPDVEQRGYPD